MENCVAESKKDEIPHENVMETTEDTKKNVYYCDVDSHITKENKQLKFDIVDEVSLITERTCPEDDELWNIDDGTDSDGDTIGNGIKVFSSLSDVLKENSSTKLKTDGNMLSTFRKSPNLSSDTFITSIDKEYIKQEVKEEFNILADKTEDLQNNDSPIEYSEEEILSCSPCSDTSIKLKTEGNVLSTIKKSLNLSSDTSKTFSVDKECIKQEVKKEFNTLVEKNKDLQYNKDTPVVNSEQEILPCSPCSDTLMQELSSMLENDRKVIAAIRKSPNSSFDSSKTLPNYKEIAKQEMIKQRIIEQEILKQEEKKKSNFSAKKKKHLQGTEKLNCKKVKNKVDQNSTNIEHLILQLENEVRSEFEKGGIFDKTINNQRPLECDVTSINCSGHPDLPSYWTNQIPPNLIDLPNPSCSNSLPESSNFCKSSFSFNSPTFVDENSVLSNQLETKSLFNFYNKVFLNDFSSLKEMSEETIEVLPLEECILVKELSKRNSSDNGDVDLETENSDNFVEDPDIVNPDILYNINLNEYYTQMELLVQKISDTPDDQTVLAECLQLPPIPENEHEPKTFTAKERYNFANGISEYEYDIDTDDWNKIMVKRAVVFTAHAGFTIANEESLYVLADVAIDYIKKLAVVMKNNFDIQENSSYPDCIDPINNSLLQIGVNGGIAELIRHYENDVFGRRDKLVKKCQHLQKIIDQYTERMLAINTKTQNSFKDDLVRENPTSEKVIIKEETKLKEERTEMGTNIDEAQSEILSTIEEVEIETQSTLVDNILSNIKIEQTESVCIDNTHCEIKMEMNETIKPEPLDSCDINIEHSERMNSKSMDVNILKHLDVKPKITPLKDMSVKDLSSLGTTNLEYLLKSSDSSNSSSSIKKNKKLLDYATLKKWLEQFYPKEIKPVSEVDPAEEARVIRKRLQEHATEFTALLERYASYNNSVSTDSDVKIAVNKFTPPQTVIVNHKADENEASSLNINNTIQNISTSVVVNKNDNNDYKIVCRYISLNPTSSNN